MDHDYCESIRSAIKVQEELIDRRRKSSVQHDDAPECDVRVIPIKKSQRYWMLRADGRTA